MAYELTYESIDATTCRVTGFTGTPVDVVVPETFEVDGVIKDVVSIGDQAFLQSAIESLFAPSIKTIGVNAFGGCSSLVSIGDMPNLNTIGDFCFDACLLLENIGNIKSISQIGSGAFYRCESLEIIKFQGNKPTFGADCFDAGNELGEITGVPIPATAYISRTASGWDEPPTGVGSPEIPTAYMEQAYTGHGAWSGTIQQSYQPVVMLSSVAKTISGLDYLEGKTVDVVIDGNVSNRAVVADGKITVTKLGDRVVVGLPYTSTIAPIYIEPDAQFQQPMGKPKGLFRAVLRFKDTLSAKVGSDLQHLETVKFRRTSDNLDAQVPLYSGDKTINFNNQWKLLHTCYVVQNKPLPITLIAMIPYLEVNA